MDQHTAPLEAGSNWDVVIVGSGLSGLTAATRILQAGYERKVLVVDAVDWFGGRTRSIELAKYDSKVSIGGTFSLFEHNDTLALAKEVNCYPTAGLQFSDVNFEQFSKALFDPSGLPLFCKLMYKGSQVVKNGKIDWTCEAAKKLESVSLEEWISKHWVLNKFNPNFTREFFYLLETFPDLRGVSALVCAIALYVRFRGIPRNGIEIPPKVLRWEGGTGLFTQALVDNLHSQYKNFRLKLNSPVDSIVQPAIENDGPNVGEYPVQVVIREDRGSSSVTVNTKYVIVATSPLASAPASHGGTINYSPALRDEAATLFSSIDATPTVSRQILVVYKNRWWKKHGGGMFIMPAYATHVREKGVWGNVVDGSMSDETKPGIVRIFVDSRRIEGWSEQAVRQSAIDFLKRLFPKQHDLVDTYDDIIMHDWNTAKPSIPGVTFTYPPSSNGLLTKYGRYFTEPYGRIHWGGSERSVWGANWMEGAVERGNDVSEELLKAAKWVPASYNVRKAAAKLNLKSARMPMMAGNSVGVMVSMDMGDDEDLESEPESVTVPLSTPTSPLGLADGLKEATGAGPNSSFEELFAAAGQVRKPKHLGDSDVWLSPQDCLTALKQLEDAKRQKHEAKRAAVLVSENHSLEAEGSAYLVEAPAYVERLEYAEARASSSSSSSLYSTSSSPLFTGVTTPLPAHLPEGTTPYTLTQEKPVQGQAVAAQRSEVPAFLLGLTVGVFVTMVATIRFAKGAPAS